MTKRFHVEDAVAELTAMFKKLGKNHTVFIGIDPGQTGAIAFMPTDSRIAPIILDIPTTQSEVMSSVKGKRKKKTRTHYDYQTLSTYLDPVVDNIDRVFVVLERGQPARIPGRVDTGVTGFAIGLGYGMWQLYFATFGVRWDEIPPASWKPRMALTGKGKSDSRKLASRLFPAAAKYLALVMDHNRAEALLLAEFMRRKMNGAFT